MMELFFPLVTGAISSTAATTSAFDSLETHDRGSVALQIQKNIVLKCYDVCLAHTSF